MTISVMYTIICQGHNCKEDAVHEESLKEAKAEAKVRGYKHVKVKNGSYWDFCPDCHARYLAGEI